MSLLHERLTAPGPKRILSLDGGGVRGIITLQFLKLIEKELRTRHGNAELRLCDYFDLVGGTSTGAIIAGLVTIGMSAEEIERAYLRLPHKIFGRRKKFSFCSRYSSKPLEDELQKTFGDHTLESDILKTGLCLVTKRADTGSTWPLINHPDGTFFDDNKNILIRKAIRASTAAPTYYKAEKIDVGGGEAGAFIDGAVSTANNPSLLLFLVATLKGFPFHWTTGADSLFLVSVGTGIWRKKLSADQVCNSKMWTWAVDIPQILLKDVSRQNQLMLQLLSRTHTPHYFNMEIGSPEDDLGLENKLLTCNRYDVELEDAYCRPRGFLKNGLRIENIRRLDAIRHVPLLQSIGAAAAEEQVRPDHFPGQFDIV